MDKAKDKLKDATMKARQKLGRKKDKSCRVHIKVRNAFLRSSLAQPVTKKLLPSLVAFPRPYNLLGLARS